jgi:lysophospholipase L1-like esterase
MAAVGDSITAATDVGWCCVNPNGSNPQYSWSTGSNVHVNSHAQRITELRGRTPIFATDLAKPGADSANLDGQLAAAASALPGGHGVDYVTVLMGGNDLCVSSVADMTDPGVFETRVHQALAHFFARNPTGRMLLTSIPNAYRLWQLERHNPLAELIWNTFDVCPTMLSLNNTEAQRQQFVQLELVFNQKLAQVCSQFAQCRWDNNAVYNAVFSTGDVSPVDFYHPSMAGQRLLAAVTWKAGYWATMHPSRP